MLNKENLDLIEQMILSRDIDNAKIAATMLRNSRAEFKELNKRKRTLQCAVEYLLKNPLYLPKVYASKEMKDWFSKNFYREDIKKNMWLKGTTKYEVL